MLTAMIFMMFGNQLALGSPVRPWTKIELYSLRTTVCACVVPVNGDVPLKVCLLFQVLLAT